MRWGQFNVCLPQDHLNKLMEYMQKKVGLNFRKYLRACKGRNGNADLC
jgi:hypothetical protein